MKSKLKPSQWKAMQYYIEKHNLKPQLSAYPIMQFLNEKGESEAHHIDHIVMEYNRDKKEAKKKATA